MQYLVAQLPAKNVGHLYSHYVRYVTSLAYYQIVSTPTRYGDGSSSPYEPGSTEPGTHPSTYKALVDSSTRESDSDTVSQRRRMNEFV